MTEPATRARIRPATFLLLVLVILALAGAATAEVMLSPPVTPAAEPVVVDPPTSGAWYCPVTGTAEDTAVLTIAAVGEAPAVVVVTRHRAEGPAADAPIDVPTGAPVEVVLDGGEAQWASTVRWSGGPVVTTWRVEGVDTAGARCETAPEPRTLVTGFETTARSASTLHLFNPFARDAVVRVTFGTPTGPTALVLTDNVSVPAGRTTALQLNEFEPEQPDLAVTVEVLTGRVVTQGLLALAPTANQPGPTGRAVLTGTPVPDLAWSFAYARSDDTAASWLSVYNPNAREAAVEVRVANPLPDSPGLLGETSVPAGGVVRIDLTETSASLEFGVEIVVVNAEPVVATRLTDVQTAGGSEGLSATSGERAAATWALIGSGTADRHGRISVYNPGPDAVTAAIDAGEETPADWAAIRIDANQQISRELTEAGANRDAVSVLVRADGPVVADIRTQSAGESLRFWTSGGVPSSRWEGPGSRPAVRRDARLSTRPAQLVTDEPSP
jgi:hypothetical protein